MKKQRVQTMLLFALSGFFLIGFEALGQEPSPTEPAGQEEAPAPKGLSGTWYEMTLDCPFCLSLEDQKIRLNDKETILHYGDRMEVAPDIEHVAFFKRSGADWTSEAAQGRKNEKKKTFTVLQYAEHRGEHTSSVFARIWVLTALADAKILYGRKYLVNAFADEAFEATEAGYRAQASYLTADILLANLDDVRVYSLNETRKMYQPSDQVRFVLDGASCYVRENVEEADFARAHDEVHEKKVQYDQRLDLFRTLVRQGDQAYHAADYEDALNRYKAASALLPEFSLVHADLGAVYQVQNKLPEAETAYRLAVELDPTDLDTRFNLAQVLEQQGRLAEALQLYRGVVEKRPNDAEANEHVVKLERKLGR